MPLLHFFLACEPGSLLSFQKHHGKGWIRHAILEVDGGKCQICMCVKHWKDIFSFYVPYKHSAVILSTSHLNLLKGESPFALPVFFFFLPLIYPTTCCVGLLKLPH